MADAAPGKVGALTGRIEVSGPTDITALVRERKRYAVDRYGHYFRKCARWYDLYRGTYTGRFQAWRNNIQIPFLFSVIQSDVARKAQTSFGAWPIVEFTGYSHADGGIARKNEVLVSAQMKDCNSFCKAVDFFTSADMYGTAFARIGWKQERELAQMRVPMPGPDGQMSEQVMRQMVDRYNGPDWDVIDILDALPQPGKRSIEECDWFIHRYFMDLDRLRELAQLGMYDKAALDRVTWANAADADREYEQRRSQYRNYGDYESRRGEKFAKPVEIVEMWGRVPVEFAPDGYIDRVVTIANGSVVLRNRPNPFWHGRIPFLAYCPMPDPHFFHGPGKMEIGEKMQFAANRFANQKMDALDQVIDPMWLFDRTRGIDSHNLYTRAGKAIGIDGPVTDDVIRPLSPDLRGLQLAYQEIGTLWEFIQQGTGIIEDTVQGAPASRRQTAHEFQGRQENVLTRLMLETRLAEEGFVEPLANMFVALNKQFLPVPKTIQIMGTDAVNNPITGLPMPQESVDIMHEDINHNYRARAVGSTQMLGRAARQQNMMGLLQVMGSNPVALQMVNWTAFFRQIFEAFDMRNFDELLVQGQVPQVNQNALAGGPPEGQSPMNQALDPNNPGGQPGAGGGLGASPGYGDLPPDVTAGILQQLEGQMPAIQGARGY